MAAFRLAGEALDLVAAYENDLWEIGQLPDHKVLWGARWFLVHVGEPQALPSCRSPSSSRRTTQFTGSLLG